MVALRIASKAVTALLLFAAPASGAASASCPARSADGRCLPEGSIPGDEDGALAMLQTSAKGNLDTKARAGASKRRINFNTTALWDQLTGAVEIDDLKAKLEQKMDPEKVEEYKAQLKGLKEKFPDADEIEAKFKDQWSEVREAVNLQNITAQLKDAQGEYAEKLQAKYDQISEKLALSGLSADDIQAQATDMWADLQEQGVPLPDLDELENTAQKYMNKASDAMQQAQDALKDAIGNFSGFFR